MKRLLVAGSAFLGMCCLGVPLDGLATPAYVDPGTLAVQAFQQDPQVLNLLGRFVQTPGSTNPMPIGIGCTVMNGDPTAIFVSGGGDAYPYINHYWVIERVTCMFALRRSVVASVDVDFEFIQQSGVQMFPIVKTVQLYDSVNLP